ncbi:homeotic protein ultrabithorax-like isoform X1 [Eriocheir sinensis]|uniref:homeotic protein ultrabithorax-like isoform X1 n=1 Tax=Eriocheir sinensis TaxID=95602 RepID=UPI0021C9D0DB|nr:homeotic protein ultrabithorax-like isoform X1 [Eriocheir sinensis]
MRQGGTGAVVRASTRGREEGQVWERQQRRGMEQRWGGFYGGGSGGDQAYRFPLGLSVSPYGQPAPRQDGYDASAASCKLYGAPQDHMTPNPFKVDCAKDQNGYGISKDMSGGWGPTVRPACTPDPVVARGYPPDPSTSPRDRSSHVGAWNTCGMTPVSQPHQPPQQQPQQQTNNQMNQPPSNTTFYPWMAIAGTVHSRYACTGK